MLTLTKKFPYSLKKNVLQVSKPRVFILPTRAKHLNHVCKSGIAEAKPDFCTTVAWWLPSLSFWKWDEFWGTESLPIAGNTWLNCGDLGLRVGWLAFPQQLWIPGDCCWGCRKEHCRHCTRHVLPTGEIWRRVWFSQALVQGKAGPSSGALGAAWPLSELVWKAKLHRLNPGRSFCVSLYR